jgi:hypothetical protein
LIQRTCFCREIQQDCINIRINRINHLQMAIILEFQQRPSGAGRKTSNGSSLPAAKRNDQLREFRSRAPKGARPELAAQGMDEDTECFCSDQIGAGH